MKTNIAFVVFFAVLLASDSHAADFPTRVISNDFISVRLDITVDSMPNIQQLTVKLQDEKGKWFIAMDKKNFRDWGWNSSPRYYGISVIGDDIDIFTIATGTGNAQYYLHKYRITEKKIHFVKTELVYAWSQLDPEKPIFVGTNRNFGFKQDKNRPWDIYLDTKKEEANIERVGTAP